MQTDEIREALRRRLTHDLNALERGNLNQQAVRDVITDVYSALQARGFAVPGDATDLGISVLREVIGYGPLLPLLQDPLITEVMVNGPDKVFMERSGQKVPTNIHFDSPQHLRYVIRRLMHLSPGKRLDEGSPMVDLALPDGSRVNIIVPPAATGGPQLTIRKYTRRFQQLEHLYEAGTLSKAMGLFLDACVAARLNVLFAGAAGTGKTTLLEILGHSIQENDRLVVIEDTPELHFDHLNQVRMLTRAPNMEGQGAITTEQLFRNSLRMAPDRIILGELRGPEAFDFLQAANAGRRGTLAVTHASSVDEAVTRLENLAMMSGLPIPQSVLRRQVAHGIDIVVHMVLGSDGVRRVDRIAEVQGLGEDGFIQLQDLFGFKADHRDDAGRIHGKFMAMGNVPACLDKLRLSGFAFEPKMFQADDA